MTLDFATMALGAAIGAVAAWLIVKATQRSQQGGVDEIARHVSERFDKVSAQIDARLRDNVRAMNDSKAFLAERVSSTERTVREVSAGLGKLEQATDALRRSSQEITSFQNMLRHPKVRGSFGEVLLTNLLADIMARDRYETQFTLPSSGEIADVIIRLQDGYIVAVDAKFPLAHFEEFVHEQDPERKRRARTALVNDVKKHVSDISRKYISPSDHTLDYAFMYVPMEAVYYETMVQDTDGLLWDYCLEHRVVPVSPNSIIAYLHTILVGLRGMKIEEQAREILTNLNQVRRDFRQFAEDFTMVGKHLGNAKNRFDDSSRRLDRFTTRLDQIATDDSPSALPPETPPASPSA